MNGRTVLVTGAGSGIGRAIALVVAAQGGDVVVADLDDDAGRATCDAIDGLDGGAAVFNHVDVRERADLEAACALAIDTFGCLSGVCNLGGAPAPFVELGEVDDDQFDAVIAGHVKSVLYGCQAAAPHLRAAGGGAIVNMSSTAADRPSPGNGLYTLAKSAVMSVTRVLALELGHDGIRVNAIAPGATLTGFSTRWFTDADGTENVERKSEWLDQMAGLSPLGVVGTADDQAWLALYLLSDAGRFTTGQVLRANGGWSMP